jgi:hypothetical protein
LNYERINRRKIEVKTGTEGLGKKIKSVAQTKGGRTYLEGAKYYAAGFFRSPYSNGNLIRT